MTHTSRPVTIGSLHGSRILDSRGYPTIQVRPRARGGRHRRHRMTPPQAHPPARQDAAELRDGGSGRRPRRELGTAPARPRHDAN
ncbi:hypothetical protein QP157_21090 [Sphingomonas sp. LR61]|uniref:hypothetical protein n=1 Tax=Sphingomonas sp. LR61 TaxID=3050234 RepID=UPI002FE2D0F3